MGNGKKQENTLFMSIRHDILDEHFAFPPRVAEKLKERVYGARRMKMNDGCRKCQLDRKLNAYPADAPEERIREYQSSVLQLVNHSGDTSSPETASRISAVYRRLFGPEKDFSAIKEHFNALMMELWDDMQERVRTADDPLEMAVQLAMTGNFIDFVALDHVDEGKLRDLIMEAHRIPVSSDMLEQFRGEIIRAHRIVYFTDNCGEIVTDKLLMDTLRQLNPEAMITAVVRGLPVANDATMEDAVQIRLNETAQQVLGSGNDIPGAVLERFSADTMEAVKKADLLIAKGQGNYEGLSGCGLNLFYIFMCKCSFFMERFGVRQLTGILTRE